MQDLVKPIALAEGAPQSGDPRARAVELARVAEPHDDLIPFFAACDYPRGPYIESTVPTGLLNDSAEPGARAAHLGQPPAQCGKRARLEHWAQFVQRPDRRGIRTKQRIQT